MTVVPDNATLSEARDLMLNHQVLDPILGLISIGRSVRIRFVHEPLRRLTAEQDLPEDTKYSEFCRMAQVGSAKLIIDDSGGGLFARPRVPEPA